MMPFYADFDIRVPVNGHAPGVVAFFRTDTHQKLCEVEGDFFTKGLPDRAADAVASAAPDITNAKRIAHDLVRQKVETLCDTTHDARTTAVGPPAPRPAPLVVERPPGGREFLDKNDPLPTARRFLESGYVSGGSATLVHSGDVFYAWNGTAYVYMEMGALRAQLYPWLETFHRKVVGRGGLPRVERFKPTKRDVEQTVDALKALTYSPCRPPSWLRDQERMPNPDRLLVATNGILDLAALPNRPLMPPTPDLFTTNALDYAIEPAAPRPSEWLRFLGLAFDDDMQSIGLLQEFAGYVLTADTRQQKILMLIGPKRSGKGTIARVLSRLIGLANVCAPTLASLGMNFGLWPLVNKRLAIISDARLGRTDQAVVTERLLSISGEDAITIDRKNMTPLTVKLPTRFMICTNELPRLTDSSGALASRFFILQLNRSFYGSEDIGLTDRLLTDLPGILQWAITGWRRLDKRGRFVQPAAGQSIIDELHDLASPIGAFVRDRCQVDRRLRVPVDELYSAWCLWCKEQGRDHAGTVQVFGRDLRSVVPHLATRQPREGEQRIRQYEGIDLTGEARAAVAYAAAGTPFTFMQGAGT